MTSKPVWPASGAVVLNSTSKISPHGRGSTHGVRVVPLNGSLIWSRMSDDELSVWPKLSPWVVWGCPWLPGLIRPEYTRESRST